MQKDKIIILAAVGIGAYLLMSQARATAAARSGQQYRMQGMPPGGGMYPSAPNPTSAAEAAAYKDVGSLLGNIYRRIGKGGSQDVSMPPVIPDDAIMANPPGNADPYLFEAGQFLGGPA